jgi:hypothetical protein
MYNCLRPTTPHQINNVSWIATADKLCLWPRPGSASFTPGAGLSPVMSKQTGDRAGRSDPARLTCLAKL